MDQLAPRTISLRLMVRVTHNVTIVTSWAAKDFTRDCVHSLVGRAQWRKSHQGRVACENERRTSSGIEEVSSYHCHKVLEESLSSRETWVAEFSVLESFLQKINELWTVKSKHNKFIRSFFGRIYSAAIFFQFYLTFRFTEKETRICLSP